MGIKIEYNREKCIGAGICSVFSPEHFQMDQDGKANLLESRKEGNLFVKDVSEEDLEKLKQSADGCPAKVITIKKDREKIAPEE